MSVPDWDTYRKEIPAGLNYCATGMPYWTVDIGGFVPYAFADSPEYPNFWSGGMIRNVFCLFFACMAAEKRNSGITIKKPKDF